MGCVASYIVIILDNTWYCHTISCSASGMNGFKCLVHGCYADDRIVTIWWCIPTYLPSWSWWSNNIRSKHYIL
jgi:hypothetical protein